MRFAFKPYRRPFRVPVRTSRTIWEVREGILVRLEAEDGRCGFGEIAPIEAFGTESFVAALTWCSAVPSESAAEALRKVPRELPCTAGAVGAALASLGRDAGAQADGKADPLPVAKLLPTGAAAVEGAAQAADQGFGVFKLKIGAVDFETERAVVDRVAGRLPSGGRLRLDANGGLDVRGAVRWLRAAEKWPVEFIEQPLPPESGRDLAKLAADHTVPLALDEAVRSADDIRRWRDCGWPGLFVLKPALAGPSEDWMREVAEEPERFVFSSALETDIGTQAGLRLAFAAGVTRALGYGVGAFFPEDGLGGGIATPALGLDSLAEMKPEAVWNRL